MKIESANHSAPLKWNLQQFAGEEGFDDAILPDDFQPETATPQAEGTPEQGTEEVKPEVEDTKPTEETTAKTEPAVENTPKVKIKYNHEEREIPLDEAALLAQKGLNYEKAVERARQEARDAFIAEQGYMWNGKPITTEAEYKQALMEQELINKYKDQQIPEDVIKELVENRKFREQFESERQTKAEQEKKDQEFLDFFKYYKQAHGREFDPEKDTIPQSVWEAQAKGVPLRYAYAEHLNNELKSQLQILKQNKENEQKAPVGSVTTHGSTEVAVEDDFLKGFNSVL